MSAIMLNHWGQQFGSIVKSVDSTIIVEDMCLSDGVYISPTVGKAIIKKFEELGYIIKHKFLQFIVDKEYDERGIIVDMGVRVDNETFCFMQFFDNYKFDNCETK